MTKGGYGGSHFSRSWKCSGKGQGESVTWKRGLKRSADTSGWFTAERGDAESNFSRCCPIPVASKNALFLIDSPFALVRDEASGRVAMDDARKESLVGKYLFDGKALYGLQVV